MPEEYKRVNPKRDSDLGDGVSSNDTIEQED